jgi:acetyl esterase/lipase
MRDAYLDSVEDVEISGVRVQVCTPKGSDPSKDDRAVLYFFGGGSVVGSPLEDLAISARLAQSLGLKIYAPYYRLAPGNLAVAGESAGGNLAAATGGEVGRQLPRLHLPARDVAGNRHAAFPTRQVRPTRSG